MAIVSLFDNLSSIKRTSIERLRDSHYYENIVHDKQIENISMTSKVTL